MLSTVEAFEEACSLLGREATDHIIFLLPDSSQAEIYLREFAQRLAFGNIVRRVRGRLELFNGAKVHFLSSHGGDPGYETCLRGLCAALFRPVPGSRDERHLWRWELDDRWPGHYERFRQAHLPPPPTRFDRIDKELV